jgi:hypothetical protein
VSGGGGSSAAEPAEYSTGSIDLGFEEDYPLVGARTLKATVSLKDVEPFQVMFLSFKNENPIFRFTEWRQDSAFRGRTACVDVVRNGQKEIVVIVAGPKNADARSMTLGYFELNVLSRKPLELTGDDFSVVTADILALSGRELAFGASRVARSTEPAVFRNELAQNHPNPFNPTTAITFSIAKDSDVELVIYEVTGARVKTLVSDHRAANNYEVVWDGKDSRGRPVATGVYFCRLIAGSFRATKKMVLLR